MDLAADAYHTSRLICRTTTPIYRSDSSPQGDTQSFSFSGQFHYDPDGMFDKQKVNLTVTTRLNYLARGQAPRKEQKNRRKRLRRCNSAPACPSKERYQWKCKKRSHKNSSSLSIDLGLCSLSSSDSSESSLFEIVQPIFEDTLLNVKV